MSRTRSGDDLVSQYCQDTQQNLDHASGQVFQNFTDYGYTVAQLEATQLWERLAVIAKANGEC